MSANDSLADFMFLGLPISEPVTAMKVQLKSSAEGVINGGTLFCSSRRLARWNCQLANFLQMSVIVKMSTEVDDFVRKPARAAEMSTTIDLQGLGPIYTKRRRQHRANSEVTLAT